MHEMGVWTYDSCVFMGARRQAMQLQHNIPRALALLSVASRRPSPSPRTCWNLTSERGDEKTGRMQTGTVPWMRNNLSGGVVALRARPSRVPGLLRPAV